MRNLSLNQVLLLLFLVLSTLIGIQVLDAVYLRRDVVAIEREWDEFQADRSDRARLKSALRSVLGYGGFIHNYSNYFLRKQYEYYEGALENLGGARTLIGAYRTLLLSPAEENALQDMDGVLDTYEVALRRIGELIEAGVSAHEIEAQVRVDDRLALRGLDMLLLDSQPQQKISKTRRLARLRAALGYGGFIHGFKHYILTEDAAAADLAKQMLNAARQAVASYRAAGVSGGELSALEDIDATLQNYEIKLALIEDLVAEGVAPEVIDATVKVDDSLAFRALRSLSREINQDIVRRSEELTASLRRAARLENAVFWGSVGLLGLGGFLAFWLIRGTVVRPLIELNGTMMRLAEGDLGAEIQGVLLRNEIGEMARSVKVFKSRTIELHETEQKLRISHEELNAQLRTLQYLKEESEKQAAQAIGLAENLAVARDAAEKATARAEADELRIRTIVETTTDAIITIDSKGIIESFNLSAQTIFGWRVAEVIGRNVSILMPDLIAGVHEGYVKNFSLDRPSKIVGNVMENEGLRRDGSTFPLELSVNAMRIDGELKFTGIIRDTTERKKAEDEIRRLAMTDPLTGLANRNRFLGRFADALVLARRKPDWNLAVMMLDLDNFKPVNDTFGHPVGDALLKEVAAQLGRHTRESDTVARFGGDEFAAVLVDSGGPEAAGQIAKRIAESLSAPLSILGHEVQIGVSIGIAFFPGDGETPDDLLRKADLALYEAKAAGKNTWRFYEASLEA